MSSMINENVLPYWYTDSTLIPMNALSIMKSLCTELFGNAADFGEIIFGCYGAIVHNPFDID